MQVKMEVQHPGVMHNAPCNPYLQTLAVRCALISLLLRTSLQCISCLFRHYIWPRCRGGYGHRLLESPSHRSRLLKVARVITTITGHRLSIVWHQLSLANHSNMGRNVFDESNHCESNAIGHRVRMQTRPCFRLNVSYVYVPRQNRP